MDVLEDNIQSQEEYIIGSVLSSVGKFQIITNQMEKSDDIFSACFWNINIE